jgi:hypothetical protein
VRKFRTQAAITAPCNSKTLAKKKNLKQMPDTPSSSPLSK